MAEPKEIRGILKNWTLNNNVITGEIVYVSVLVQGKGNYVTTSEVVRMFRVDNNETLIVETKNSLYILL